MGFRPVVVSCHGCGYIWDMDSEPEACTCWNDSDPNYMEWVLVALDEPMGDRGTPPSFSWRQGQGQARPAQGPQGF